MILLQLKPITDVIIWSTCIIIVLIIMYNGYIMTIASKSIFRGSGAPINMAKTIINSIEATSQFLFGIFIVSVLFILIIEGIISSEVGIPVVTSVIGFLLGKTQGSSTEKRGSNSSNKKNENSNT